MKLQRLLKTRFAMVVKEAIEKRELGYFNVYAWTTEYNGGIPDKQLRDEVWKLLEYFNK